MLGRSTLTLATAALLVGAAGCSGQTPTTPKSGETPAKTAATVVSPATISVAPAASPASQTGAPAASPAAASPAATSPGAASPAAVPRGESKGKVTYAFESSIASSWLDPQENPSIITPYFIQFALHDAVIKPLPGKPFAPSLAESYDVAPDFKSVTIKLREGIKFHDGTPVTPADVKFTFEKYRGANAKILHDKTDRIETPDAKTVKFIFKEPFLDFIVLYGSPASGAGWVVPQKYYEQVGPNGYKQKPIGAGPYKFVRQVAGSEIELAAVPDYWRRTPAAKTLVIKGIAEAATRLAALQSGEADLINSLPGELIETVQKDPKLTLAPVLTNAPQWLEFPGWEKADNPFHDIRVRQAVSLGLDRKAIVDAETAGLAPPMTNWITLDMPGAIKGPEPVFDRAKARQLMADAGFANGFEVEGLTPVPPRYSVGERLVTQLREIGIRTKVNQMERGAYATKITEGVDAFKGILLSSSGAPGDAASRVRAYAICQGSSSRTCVPEIDQKFNQYEKSLDPTERQRLLTEIQQYVLDNSIFVGVYQLVLPHAQGPRIVNKWDSIWGAIPQYIYVGPYEDITVKD